MARVKHVFFGVFCFVFPKLKKKKKRGYPSPGQAVLQHFPELKTPLNGMACNFKWKQP